MTLSRLSSVLERHSAASAVLLRTVIDEARGSHVLAGMPHGLVNGELVFGLPPRAPAQQDLAELRAHTRIETSQFAAASWWGLEGQPGLHEEAAPLDHPGVQFTAGRVVANRGDMHPGREPVGADHRLTCIGAEAHDVGFSHGLLSCLNRACPGIGCRQLLSMNDVARCNADLRERADAGKHL